MLIFFLIQILSFLLLLKFLQQHGSYLDKTCADQIDILIKGRKNLFLFKEGKCFLGSLLSDAKKKGLSLSQYLLFVEKIFHLTDKFHKKNKQMYSLIKFRFLMIAFSGFFVVFCLVIFLEAFLFSFFLLKQLIANMLVFFLYSMVSSFFIRKLPCSFFYQDSYSLIGKKWLNSYLLGFVFNHDYKKLRSSMILSGVSLEKEKKIYLENWLLEKFRQDEEWQEKFFEMLPLYELLANTFALGLMSIPLISSFVFEN